MKDRRSFLKFFSGLVGLMSAPMGVAAPQVPESVPDREHENDFQAKTTGMAEMVGIDGDFTIELWFKPIIGSVLHTRLIESGINGENTPTDESLWTHIAIWNKKSCGVSHETAYGNGIHCPEQHNLISDTLKEGYSAMRSISENNGWYKISKDIKQLGELRVSTGDGDPVTSETRYFSNISPQPDVLAIKSMWYCLNGPL